MNKIKVCHIVCGLKSGGVEAMIYNYCSNIGNDLYEWYLLYQHEPAEKNIDELEKIGFSLKRIPSKVKHPIKNYKATYDFLKKNKIDVVHCHMTLMNFIPLIAAKKLKIKIRICHSHNSDTRKKNIVIKLVEKILKQICIKNATHLVACGKDAGKYMFGKNKFDILYNAMNLEKYQFDQNVRKEIRKKYNIGDNKYVIGHIGRFTKQKNQSFIIDLFKQICQEDENCVLFLVGDGEQKEYIIKKIKEYDLQEKVILPGVVNNSNQMYSAFDIFILPSLWEGLPVVSIEAQASGLPIILSDNIDKKAIIDFERCKMLRLNIKEWKDSILEQKIKCINRKVNFDLFVKKNLDIKTEIDKLKKIYNEGKD